MREDAKINPEGSSSSTASCLCPAGNEDADGIGRAHARDVAAGDAPGRAAGHRDTAVPSATPGCHPAHPGHGTNTGREGRKRLPRIPPALPSSAERTPVEQGGVIPTGRSHTKPQAIPEISKFPGFTIQYPNFRGKPPWGSAPCRVQTHPPISQFQGKNPLELRENPCRVQIHHLISQF